MSDRARACVFACLVAGLASLVSIGIQAQSGAPPLSAADSDPAKMGWMSGSPPPADKTIRYEDLSFFRFPMTRWSFAHLRQFLPTATVWRGDGAVSKLPRAERDDIDDVTFTPMDGAKPMTWAQSLDANYTDAIVVLHEGRIVYERYRGVMTPHTQHIAFSVTKSFVGTLGQMLVSDGTLDENARVTKYVPELEGSAFADATVRQVLDMTTGLAYSENYADPKADIWRYSVAGGLFPRPAGYDGPRSLYAYLRTLQKEGEHGTGFSYKSVNTEVLGWILRRVTGKPLEQLLSERFWQKLGAEQDGYVLVDSEGAAFAAGGFDVTLRDLARFGEMMRLGGRFNGQQIVPRAVVDEITKGASREGFTKGGYKTLPGWSYRDMWWISHNPHGAYMARGIHGQAIYVDPKAEMVIARFGSHPLASGTHFDPTTLPAFHALAGHLMRR
jgi:CubicO group peptidase (beta-lactamase class C family)